MVIIQTYKERKNLEEVKCWKIKWKPVDNIERIISIRRRVTMKKFECEPCGYIYDPVVGDPDSGIAPGTAFEDIPDDWVCPICGLGKDVFVPVEG